MAAVYRLAGPVHLLLIPKSTHNLAAEMVQQGPLCTLLAAIHGGIPPPLIYLEWLMAMFHFGLDREVPPVVKSLIAMKISTFNIEQVVVVM